MSAAQRRAHASSLPATPLVLMSSQVSRLPKISAINTYDSNSLIVDTIFNHMTGQSSGTGVAGDSFTHYNYPGTYSSSDFHYCGLEPNNAIVNYNNRAEVQTCELVGLAESVLCIRRFPGVARRLT